MAEWVNCNFAKISISKINHFLKTGNCLCPRIMGWWKIKLTRQTVLSSSLVFFTSHIQKMCLNLAFQKSWWTEPCHIFSFTMLNLGKILSNFLTYEIAHNMLSKKCWDWKHTLSIDIVITTRTSLKTIWIENPLLIPLVRQGSWSEKTLAHNPLLVAH